MHGISWGRSEVRQVGTCSGTQGPPQARLKAFSAWLIVLLAGAATAALWIDGGPVARLIPEPLLLLGAVVAVVVWILVLASAMNFRRASELRERLGVLRNQESLVEVPIDLGIPDPIGIAFLPGLIAFALVLTGTAVLHFQPSAADWSMPLDDRVHLSLASTSLIWFFAVLALFSYARVRRLEIEFGASDSSGRLVGDVLESLPVMVSICMPDGTRSKFNARFREVTGRDETQLAGHEWLTCVHEADREIFGQLQGSDRSRKRAIHELEYGMITPHGTNRWIRERFVPRHLDSGELVGYLAVGIDITTQVEAETRRTKELEEMSEQVERDRAKVNEATIESRGLKSELSKTTKSRDRYKDKAEQAKEKQTEAEKRAEKAKQSADDAVAERKTADVELKNVRAENRKLDRAAGRLESQVEALERSEADMGEQLKEAQRRLDSAVAAAAEDRQAVSQLRTKVNRLTSLNQELTSELEQAQEARNAAVEQSSLAQKSVDQEVTRRSRMLAGTLRPQIDGVHALLAHLRDASVSDDQLNELDTVHASIASMLAMLDGALGADADPTDATDDSDVRSFDMRAAVESVSKLLEPVAANRGVKLECIIDPDSPTQVCGDSVRIREALLILGSQALNAVEDGALTIKLESDGSTEAFVVAKIVIAHDTARLDDDALKYVFAVDPDQQGLDDCVDPSRSRAAVAWDLIRNLKGEFGLEASKQGGFEVWFSLNLTRWTTTAQKRQAGLESTVTEPPTPEPQFEASPTPMARQLHQAVAAVAVTPPPVSVSPARNAPRLPQEHHKSNLGEVTELGPRGARIRCSKQQRGLVTLVLTTSDNERIELKADVVSSDKKSARNHDTILEFIDLSPRLHKQILEIAVNYRPLTMRPLSDSTPGIGARKT